MGFLGDRGDGYTGLAQSGNNLEKRYFPAGQTAGEHANHGVALGQRGERALDGGAEAGDFAEPGGTGDFGIAAVCFFGNMRQRLFAALGRRRGTRIGNHGIEKADLVAANVQQVTIEQVLLLDGATVDIGAVGAAQVFNADLAARDGEHGMLAADRQILDHDVVVGTTTQGRALLGELYFLDDCAVD